MAESINYEKFPYLEYFKQKRKESGLEKLDIDQLTAQTGSQDPALAEKSKRLLIEKWNLDPEKDAENAPSIDIMRQLEGFSEEEKTLMFSQLVGIQLTEGCNGNCPFCLFGKKKGVEAKYSFESLSAFIKKYGNQFAANFNFYWDSDPFDYRDNGKNFLDVYKAWREVEPEKYHYISTSIPRGGEDDFINFIRHAAEEWRSKKLDGWQLGIRISLAKHNAQRVETVFEKIIGDLSINGFSEQKINKFLKEIVFISGIFEAHKLGQLIGAHEDIKDVYTPACQDGILITPNSFEAIMITSPTIYEPSGQKNINITSGELARKTPLKLNVGDYVGFNALKARIDGGRTILRRILSISGEFYTLENPVDDIVLKLGREAASYGRFIEELQRLPHDAEKLKDIPENEWKKFLNESAIVFRQRQGYNNDLIKSAEKLISKDILPSSEKEKIQFYILLSKTYSAEIDFLAGQIENNQPFEAMAIIATIFRHVGREQVSKLPEIISELIRINKIAKSWNISIHDITMARARIKSNLAAYFGFSFPFPDWLMESVDSYCDSIKKNTSGGKKNFIKNLARKFLILQ